jgi:hypothetical protein
MKKSTPLLLARVFVCTFIALSSLRLCSAQLVPASPPIADPSDSRFDGTKEDWTTPELATSTLHQAQPLVGYVNDYPFYTVELLQLQWRFGDPLDLYVMKPKGVPKPPVILYLYSFPEDTDRFKKEDFQAGATKDGFAAVGFVSALTGHRYHDRPMKEWFISELQESLATSAHDVQMVLDYLGRRGDLDMNRVGMFAIGSGASIGILASAVDARIKVLDTFNPWGDWPVWMAASPFVSEDERAEYVRPDFLKKVTLLDPVDWLPKVRAEKFRLQDETFDTRTPKVAKEKLRSAVPANATVTIYRTREDMDSMIGNHGELDWIKHELAASAVRAQAVR